MATKHKRTRIFPRLAVFAVIATLSGCATCGGDECAKSKDDGSSILRHYLA